MKIIIVCGCGSRNYNLNDWTCHFKQKGFLNGMKNLLLTEIKINS
jgi:hypothetical protein